MLYVTKSCFLGVPANEINNFILKTDKMLKSGPYYVFIRAVDFFFLNHAPSSKKSLKLDTGTGIF